MGSRSAPYQNDALAAIAVLVRTGLCSLCGYHVYNPGSAATYIQFFDAAAASEVTVGTAVHTFAIGLPITGGAARTLSKPLKFTKGIVVACTSGVATNGAPQTANVVELEVGE